MYIIDIIDIIDITNNMFMLFNRKMYNNETIVI